MIKYVLIGLGGAIGTVARFMVSSVTCNFFVTTIFPWGTLIVNLTGSFIIGLLAGLYEANLISPNLRTFLFVGILGGYTTFSSFSLETLNLLRSGEIRYAVINLTVSNLFGIVLAFVGFYLSRYLANTLK